MNKKILIASLFATLMLTVPMTSVIGVSDVSLNRKIEKIEDNNTITETYDNEDCECEVVSKSNLVRVERQLARLEFYINIILLRFGHILEIAEKCQELLDIINSDSLWDFPIICAILESISNQLILMLYKLEYLSWKYKDNPIISIIIMGFGNWIFWIELFVGDAIHFLGC